MPVHIKQRKYRIWQRRYNFCFSARRHRFIHLLLAFFRTPQKIDAMTIKTLKTRNIVSAILIFVFLTFAFLALRPLPKASKTNCIKHTGVVSAVLKGDGEGDIVIKLEHNKNYFYINRAIDNGLSLEELKEKLLSKEVELLTISHWTPLDPVSQTKHIAEIKTEEALIYSEL